MFLRSPGKLVTGYCSSWYNIVERYLLRDLILHEDRFPVIRALSARLRNEQDSLMELGYGLKIFIVA
jgi:hypothetical protein